MEKRSHLRKQLGLTQQQLALLIGISRAHYAMYESGKRSIPLSASQVLRELAVDANGISVTNKIPNPEYNQHTREILGKLLKENAYQYQKTQRAIAPLVNKQQVADKNTTLRQIINNTQTKSDSQAKITSILGEMATQFKQSDSDALLKLEIRLEVLELEKALLERRLKGNTTKDSGQNT